MKILLFLNSLVLDNQIFLSDSSPILFDNQVLWLRLMGCRVISPTCLYCFFYKVKSICFATENLVSEPKRFSIKQKKSQS
jgi:hypothetical protein